MFVFCVKISCLKTKEIYLFIYSFIHFELQKIKFLVTNNLITFCNKPLLLIEKKKTSKIWNYAILMKFSAFIH